MVEESYRYQVDYWALGKMFQDKYKADMYFATNISLPLCIYVNGDALCEISVAQLVGLSMSPANPQKLMISV